MDYKNKQRGPYDLRDKDTYYVSEILKADFDNFHEMKLQNNLFRQMQISKKEWEMATVYNFGDEKIKYFHQKLLEYEAKWISPLDSDTYSIEFQDFKENTVFLSIKQIEKVVTDHIEKFFPIRAWLNFDKDDVGNLVEQDIIDLYNFIIKSGILSFFGLLQLLYPVTYTNLDDLGINEDHHACTISANGRNNKQFSEMIGMNLSHSWFNLILTKSKYTSGFSTTAEASHSIVHEFAHAFCFYYNLGPQHAISLNRNISDSNLYEKFENKILYHFNNNFPNQWDYTYHIDLVSEALNFVVKKIVGKATGQLFYENQWMLVLFAKWIAVPGDYGRTPLRNHKYGHPDSEWFAEGFAYYFLTPVEHRDKIWEIWHEFFTINNRNSHCLLCPWRDIDW